LDIACERQIVKRPLDGPIIRVGLVLVALFLFLLFLASRSSRE
jgi:hypothetical protein